MPYDPEDPKSSFWPYLVSILTNSGYVVCGTCNSSPAGFTLNQLEMINLSEPLAV